MKIGKKSAHAHPVYSWHRPSSRKVKRACPGKVERERERERECMCVMDEFKVSARVHEHKFEVDGFGFIPNPFSDD